MAKDLCYSETTRNEFASFHKSHEGSICVYEAMKEIIKTFSDGFEKFYPAFYAKINSKREISKFPPTAAFCLVLSLPTE